ncbi:MAG: YraN family protein [Bacillota bacterium]
MKFKNNREFGRWGEQKAKSFLDKKGYKIISENFRVKQGEIDLIVKKKNVLVFVEVKTRKSNFFGPPQAAVNFEKQNKLRTIAKIFLLKNNYKKYKKRFDVIAIIYDNDIIDIEHYKNTF